MGAGGGVVEHLSRPIHTPTSTVHPTITECRRCQIMRMSLHGHTVTIGRRTDGVGIVATLIDTGAGGIDGTTDLTAWTEGTGRARSPYFLLPASR